MKMAVLGALTAVAAALACSCQVATTQGDWGDAAASSSGGDAQSAPNESGGSSSGSSSGASSGGSSGSGSSGSADGGQG
jgi:hypothetical protein